MEKQDENRHIRIEIDDVLQIITAQSRFALHWYPYGFYIELGSFCDPSERKGCAVSGLSFFSFAADSKPVINQHAACTDYQRYSEDQDGAPVIFGTQRITAHGGGDNGRDPAQ